MVFLIGMDDAVLERALLRAQNIEAHHKDHIIHLPALPAPYKTTSRQRYDPSFPRISQEKLQELYRPGSGALEGKKQLSFVFARVDGPQQFQLLPPGESVRNPRHHRREKLFDLALVHMLGFPDQGDSDFLVDAMYLDLKIALECDEEQHLDDEHHFNKLKPGYQRARDKRINQGLVDRGWYVVRVLACTSAPPFRALTAEEVYRRTCLAVQVVLEERIRNYQNGDFRGKLLIIGQGGKLLSPGYLLFDTVKEPSAPVLTDRQRAEYRGLILVQETMMQDRAAGRPLPRRNANALPIAQLSGSIMSVGSSTGYEMFWRNKLDNYDGDKIFDARVDRIDKDLTRRDSGK
jgi:hypothetical protein